jgi:hypothetical protein
MGVPHGLALTTHAELESSVVVRKFSPLHVGKQPARDPEDPNTAKQIGLAIPLSVLNRAGEMIKSRSLSADGYDT